MKQAVKVLQTIRLFAILALSGYILYQAILSGIQAMIISYINGGIHYINALLPQFNTLQVIERASNLII